MMIDDKYLIILVGIRASGKSTQCRLLSLETSSQTVTSLKEIKKEEKIVIGDDCGFSEIVEELKNGKYLGNFSKKSTETIDNIKSQLLNRKIFFIHLVPDNIDSLITNITNLNKLTNSTRDVDFITERTKIPLYKKIGEYMADNNFKYLEIHYTEKDKALDVKRKIIKEINIGVG